MSKQGAVELQTIETEATPRTDRSEPTVNKKNESDF